MLICTKCGSLWCLKVAQEARFVSTKGQKLTCLPRGLLNGWTGKQT